jgi:hypothetical protein
MTTSANDIFVSLSGGTSNINPNLSLGGEPSIFPILRSSLNNLFDDVKSDVSQEGIEDYRCIYIFNDGDTTIWNVKLFISFENTNGAIVQIGIYELNEYQRLIITGASPSTTGKIVLSFSGQTFDLVYNPNIPNMAVDLENSLNNLIKDVSTGEKFFKDVFVTAQGTTETNVFDIRWRGKDSKRSFDRINLANNGNQLDPTANVSLSVIQSGSPINTIAGEINNKTTPPSGVLFSNSTFENPILIPFLDPNDGLPLWVKRTVVAGTTATENDGFNLRIEAESLEPIED